ncbi:MAG: phosphoesterase, partial [Synechococcus sp. MOX_bin32]|nr:phosphoesterase [Synechococcus sp. MOX_bin32]
MNVLAVVDPRLVLDVLFASSIGFLLFSRVNEQRTLWLLRG